MLSRNEKKKKQEMEIVSKVYNLNDYIYDPNEEHPDFILKSKKDNKTIGIEVTKLYVTESNARLKEKPGYLNMILKNKLDKRDIGILKPSELYIKDKKTSAWIPLINAVKKTVITDELYENRLIETIEKKVDKSKNYKDVDILELFIDDKENYFKGKNYKSMNYLYNSKRLIDCVGNSPFDRVYLFTKCNNERILLIIGNIFDGPLATLRIV
ncbi:MAG: hypothetical protein PHE05_03850 [Bacilli bacterium]|nr:hypothetical protein [Bacilli bacterium]